MAEKTYYNFNTPIGRLVSGQPSTFRTTNQAGEPLKYKSGPNKGEPKREYSIGVAFDKDQSDVPAFIRELNQYAAYEWPNIFDADLNCSYEGFAGKITDGDSTKMNKRQHRPCDNPNYKNCWVIWFTSDREPTCTSAEPEALIPADAIKCGYYVRVKASCVKNSGDTPGMYMNLEGVELAGYGPEISNRPDVLGSFKQNKATVIPKGMSRVPVAKGDSSVASDDTAPPPPRSPKEGGSDKVVYKGVTYDRSQLRDRGWTEAQISALPCA